MTYRLVRSRRRRRSISLRVLSDSSLEVRAPFWTPKFVIDRFVLAKSDWIAKRRSQISKPTMPARRHFSDDELKDYVGKELTRYSRQLGLTPHGVRFKQVRSYWGNCSPKGVLSFNLQLAYAPPPAVTYVVVHELAHLKWKGHGQRFWQLVTATYPPANDMRRVLRQISREQSRNL